jgi:hypothetical protein
MKVGRRDEARSGRSGAVRRWPSLPDYVSPSGADLPRFQKEERE